MRRSSDRRSAGDAEKPVRLPQIKSLRSGGHEYAVVYWRGSRYALGRRDDPDHLAAYQKFCDSIRLTGAPPTKDELADRSYLLADLIADYLDHAAIYYRYQLTGKPTPAVQKIRTAVRPLLHQHGSIAAKNYTLDLLKAHRQHLIDQGLGRITVNDKIQAIKQMFRWAAEDGKLPAAVPAQLSVLKQLRRGRTLAADGEPREPVATEHVEATLPFLPTPVATLLKVMSLTGMRVGEAVQLRGQDVDHSRSPWIFRPPHHKTLHHGKKREVPIGPQAQLILRSYLQRPDADYWFSPREAVDEHKAERRSNRKTKLYESHVRHQLKKRSAAPRRAPRAQYDSNAVGKALRKGIQRANAAIRAEHPGVPASELALIPYWTTHQLRYAALSRVRDYAGIEAAQAIGGHGSLGMTEHYTDSARQNLAEKTIAAMG